MPIDWKSPDYGATFENRRKWLAKLRADPSLWLPLKAFYKTRPVDFITDWGSTFDPRNAEIGLPTTIPFVLFKRQEDYIDWLYELWQGREDGLTEKSRDMGVSWLCVAFAVWMWLFHAGTVVGFGSRKEEYVDKLGDPKSLFWKVRAFIALLPKELRPKDYTESKCAPHMRVINPENGATIVGEAGDNIGRGNRTSIYFKDESAYYEHADAIDAALSQTSNCKIDVSTPNGSGNAFYRKRHAGKIKVFVFDWHDDPRKDAAWYAKQCATLDPIIVAQEIDRDYEGSVANSWIQGDLVNAAQARGPADIQVVGGLRVGVDVARFGDDKTVITFRRGRLLIKQVVAAKLDVMQVASLTKTEIEAFKEAPEQIAVDSIGIGAGVADILRGNGWYPDRIAKGKTIKVVVDVNSSLRMSDGQNFNLRAFMAREMKEWLRSGSIPKDAELKSDLTALQYTFKAGELLIEAKDHAKARGIKSPDRFDSLCLTFAYPTIWKQPAGPTIAPYVPLDAGIGM